MSRRVSISNARVGALYARYQQGLSVPALAAETGMGVYSLYHLFDRDGLKLRVWRGGSGKRVKLELIQRMHADYQTMSLREVGRRYGRCRTQIRHLFVSRGLYVRPFKRMAHNPRNGQILPFIPKTPKEIEAIIAGMDKLRIPDVLRVEWRHWSIEKRAEFIAGVRRRLQSPKDRPPGPFSKNVEPFDYASATARAIAEKLNAGLGSRGAKVKIDLCSQGVIYNGELWFWCPKTGYQRGPWTPENGRPLLHRQIWETQNGRKLPPGHVVRFADGNPNNFAPKNLILATKDDVCRETQARWLMRKSREQTALLLERSTRKGKKRDGHIDTIQELKAA